MTDEAAEALQAVFDGARKGCEFCGHLPSDGPVCGVRSKREGLMCTREPGHQGKHAACGAVAHPMEEWEE